MRKTLLHLLRSSNSGQTLIEVVVAVGLVVLVLTTLASGIAIGVRNNRVARDQASAKEYVRQSLEWARNIRDQAGWEAYATIIKSTNGGVYCLPALPATYQLFNGSNTSNCSSSNVILAADGSPTVFRRELKFTKSGGTPPTQIAVEAKVTWIDGARTLTSISTLTLYPWK